MKLLVWITAGIVSWGVVALAIATLILIGNGIDYLFHEVVRMAFR